MVWEGGNLWELLLNCKDQFQHELGLDTWGSYKVGEISKICKVFI